MSRGLGQIQQQLLALLTKHRKHQHKDLLSTFDLTAAVYAIAPDPVTGIQYLSEAQLSAVRRALISMAKRGPGVRRPRLPRSATALGTTPRVRAEP